MPILYRQKEEINVSYKSKRCVYVIRLVHEFIQPLKDGFWFPGVGYRFTDILRRCWIIHVGGKGFLRSPAHITAEGRLPSNVVQLIHDCLKQKQKDEGRKSDRICGGSTNTRLTERKVIPKALQRGDTYNVGLACQPTCGNTYTHSHLYFNVLFVLIIDIDGEYLSSRKLAIIHMALSHSGNRYCVLAPEHVRTAPPVPDEMETPVVTSGNQPNHIRLWERDCLKQIVNHRTTFVLHHLKLTQSKADIMEPVVITITFDSL